MFTWPWRRFEACFARHLARKAADGLTHQRDLMLAALSANTNMDMKENQEVYQSKIDAINKGWKHAVEILYGTRQLEVAEDPLETDPLFRSLRNQGSSLRAGVAAPAPKEAGLGQRILSGAPA